VAKLVRAVKSNKTNVKEWLSGQDSYTLHKPVSKRFPRNPYAVTNIDDTWKIDRAGISSLSRYNDKYNFLLNVIDIFALFLERTSKGQDKQVNRGDFNNQ
jgi:hypothetical protein